MRNLFIMMLAIAMNAAPVMAEMIQDDGGFGSSRFSAQVPTALEGNAQPSALANSPIAVPPSDIEPAAGEEDVTPEAESLNGEPLQNSDHDAEPIIIQKDLSVR